MELSSQTSGGHRGSTQPTSHAPPTGSPAARVCADRGSRSADDRGGTFGLSPSRSQRPAGQGASGRTGNHDARFSTVFDPELSADARRRLMRKINGFWDDVATGAGCGGLALGVLYLFASFVLHFAIGLGWGWLWATVAWPVAGFVAAAFASCAGQLEHQDHAQFVERSDLDQSGRVLLCRAQSAIETALRSDVYADELLGQGVGETVLRRHEWEIAFALRDITRLRARLSVNTRTGVPGPQTAKVLNSHERALAIAQHATLSRIKALELYAAQVQAADAAKHDWERAVKVSGFNDQYLDLVARIAADEYAIAEITGLTRQAVDAAQIFRDTLQAANLAGTALTFTDDATLTFTDGR